MLIAAINGFGYRVFFLLHILAVIVAFAPGFVVPLMVNRVRRGGGSLADNSLGAHFAANSRQVHGPALALAGLFGFAMIGLSDKVWKFSQTWVSIALVLWFIMLGVLVGLLMPAEKKAGGGSAGAEQRISMFGGMLHILLLLMLIDMIWKPGA